MAATVLGAIVACFDASPAYADVATNGGLWVGEVPEEKNITNGPLAIYDYNATYEYLTENEKYANVVGTFTIIGLGLAVVEATAAKVMTAFELPGTTQAAAALTVTNGRFTTSQCSGYTASVIGERSPEGAVPYEAKLIFNMTAVIPVGAL